MSRISATEEMILKGQEDGIYKKKQNKARHYVTLK